MDSCLFGKSLYSSELKTIYLSLLFLAMLLHPQVKNYRSFEARSFCCTPFYYLPFSHCLSFTENLVSGSQCFLSLSLVPFMSDFSIRENGPIHYTYLGTLYLVNFTSTFMVVISKTHLGSSIAPTLNS